MESSSDRRLTFGRARPLPPEERRAMLVEATLPLLAEHGTKVTTKQIAQAAGVAEGTIFRVFADKCELINAAVTRAIDPGRTLADLAEVDVTLPLEKRIVEITTVLQERLKMVFNIMIAMRMHGPPKGEPPSKNKPPANGAATEKIHDEVVRLLEPDRHEFTRPVEQVAHILRMLVFSGSHPFISEGNLLTSEDIAVTVLDGVRRREPDRGDPRC